MKLSSLRLYNFRNHSQFTLEEIGGLSILTGPNGVGKTNILEAIQLLTTTSSFRNPHIDQLILKGASSAQATLGLEEEDRQIKIALRLQEGKKQYFLNQKPKAAIDIRGNMPTVLFSPDDLQLVKGSSKIKRTAIDNVGAQLTRNYYIVRKDFKKVVRYKNKLLRDEAKRELIESINETFVICAAQLFCLRTALFTRIKPLLSQFCNKLSNQQEELDAFIKPSWDVFQEANEKTPTATPPATQEHKPEEVRKLLTTQLDGLYDEEKKAKRALLGPHKDKITFLLNGEDASVFASQGQQRTITLAWKLTELAIIHQILNTKPLLLLDDVLSELDESRRELLIGEATKDIQTIITSTDTSGFSGKLIQNAHVIAVGQ